MVTLLAIIINFSPDIILFCLCLYFFIQSHYIPFAGLVLYRIILGWQLPGFLRLHTRGIHRAGNRYWGDVPSQEQPPDAATVRVPRPPGNPCSSPNPIASNTISSQQSEVQPARGQTGLSEEASSSHRDHSSDNASISSTEFRARLRQFLQEHFEDVHAESKGVKHTRGSDSVEEQHTQERGKLLKLSAPSEPLDPSGIDIEMYDALPDRIRSLKSVNYRSRTRKVSRGARPRVLNNLQGSSSTSGMQNATAPDQVATENQGWFAQLLNLGNWIPIPRFPNMTRGRVEAPRRSRVEAPRGDPMKVVHPINEDLAQDLAKLEIHDSDDLGDLDDLDDPMGIADLIDEVMAEDFQQLEESTLEEPEQPSEAEKNSGTEISSHDQNVSPSAGGEPEVDPAQGPHVSVDYDGDELMVGPVVPAGSNDSNDETTQAAETDGQGERESEIDEGYQADESSTGDESDDRSVKSEAENEEGDQHTHSASEPSAGDEATHESGAENDPDDGSVINTENLEDQSTQSAAGSGTGDESDDDGTVTETEANGDIVMRD